MQAAARRTGRGWLSWFEWMRGSPWRRLLAPISYALAIALVALALGALSELHAMQGTQGAPRPNAPLHVAGTGTARADGTTTTGRRLSPTRTPSQIATPTAGLLASDTCPLTSDAVAAETFLLNLLNRHRADAHTHPLTLNPRLTAISHAHSCDMYQHQRLDHIGSDGSTPTQRIQTLGGQLNAWGENIGDADGYGLDGGISMIDSQMMAEPLTPYDHHYNIVNSAYSQVGLGIIYANGQVWFTEDFVG